MSDVRTDWLSVVKLTISKLDSNEVKFIEWMIDKNAEINQHTMLGVDFIKQFDSDIDSSDKQNYLLNYCSLLSYHGSLRSLSKDDLFKAIRDLASPTRHPSVKAKPGYSFKFLTDLSDITVDSRFLEKDVDLEIYFFVIFTILEKNVIKKYLTGDNNA